MVSDIFLRNWILDGEEDMDKIRRYLQEVQSQYGAFISFLLSERRSSYYGKWLLKQLQAAEERDPWYYRVRDMRNPMKSIWTERWRMATP